MRLLFKYFDKILNKIGNDPTEMLHLKHYALVTNYL